MNTFSFIASTLLGFYLLYSAIKSLDKIDIIKKHGIQKQALVTEIREVKNRFDDDYEDSSFNFNHDKINYFYTVKFNLKNGQEVEKEVEFSTTKNPKRNPPFNIGIIYYSKNDSRDFSIILENNEGINSSFYVFLTIGIMILSFAAYSYENQLDFLFNFIENL